MKYFTKLPNAGDQFALALAKRYFSNDVTACDEARLHQPNLMLLGSILQWADMNSHVCGVGFVSADAVVPVAPRAIHAVRGPLTAASLAKQGLTPPTLFGDPGVLAPRLFPASSPIRHPVGVIPHYVDRGATWIEACRERGIPIIDVLAPLDTFFDHLSQCEVILSSSLHGVIFAHAYGKSAVWIELSDGVIGDGFKFFDYYLSMGVSMDAVPRIRVSDGMDPMAVAGQATTGNHAGLIDALDEAIPEAKRGLGMA